MPPQAKKRKLQKRGTIHKIRLKNFMSYDNASFKPGEKFNVIIGPNGSGKSTIGKIHHTFSRILNLQKNSLSILFFYEVEVFD